MLLVQVKMPEPIRPRGEGNLYYRDDELLRLQINQRSPLPLQLPDSLDPARAVGAATSSLAWSKTVNLLPLESPRIYTPAPDSAVLNAAELISLPPLQVSAESSEHPSATEERGAPQP